MATFNLEQSKKIYQDAQSKGLDPKKVIYLMAKDGAVFSGLDMDSVLEYGAKKYEPKAPEPSLGQKILGNIQERGENIQNIQQRREGGQSVVGEVLNMVSPKLAEKAQPIIEKVQSIAPKGIDVAKSGQVAGVIGDTFTELLGAITPEKWKEFGKDKIQQILGEKGINTIEKFNEFAQQNPMIASNIEGAVNLADVIPAVGTTKGITSVAETVGEQIARGADDAIETVGDVVQKAPDTLARFVAPDIDPKFKTALERTTKQEVDDMENIVKGAVENADNPSAFEVIGNKLADATEQVNKQVKSLTQQKKGIISQAKYGFEEFKNQTGKTILEINKQLKDSSLAKSFIARLKKVNTKLDADNAIDDLQEILYKGNKDMTIPLGSKEDRVLRGIIGKYNSQLKESLPTAYRKLNEQISQKLDSLDLLNKSLGEVVDGVPIRGASLIKQYFSPSGTKAKELFEFIKKNTGYDVGKDSVLAKYMSEIYGETRARSLLENLSPTAQGTIDKLLDFALEKSGVSDKISELARRGKVLRAKEVAK